MIAAGFGFRAGANLDSLRDAYAQAGRADVLATLRDKTKTLEALAREHGLPCRGVSAQGQHTLTQSEASRAAHGTGSVAEATALAAAGPGARLLGPRVVSSDRMATCALAEAKP